jgi:hypothetical protein
MKTINKNKIVRTIIKQKGNDGKPNSYKIDFMKFSEYDLKSEYKFINGNTELYPYKWYDLRKLYQIPSYWFLLRIFRNSTERINKQNHDKTSIITLMLEILILIKTIISLL